LVPSQNQKKMTKPKSASKKSPCPICDRPNWCEEDDSNNSKWEVAKEEWERFKAEQEVNKQDVQQQKFKAGSFFSIDDWRPISGKYRGNLPEVKQTEKAQRFLSGGAL